MLLEDLCLPRPSRVGESEERNNHCHLEEMDEQDFEKFVKAATHKSLCLFLVPLFRFGSCWFGCV